MAIKILETFIKCPNCKGLKNVNYTKKDTVIKVDCKCGTKLVKKIK